MPGVTFYEDIPYFLQNTEESAESEESKIIGEIPSWLWNGSILTTAPGLWDLPKGSFKYWLDGLPLLLKYQFGELTVKFSKKFIQTNSYQQTVKHGKPVGISFGSNPQEKRGIMKLKPFSPSELTDSILGMIWNVGGKNPFLVSDSMHFYKFNPNSLEIMEKFSTVKSFGMNTVCPFLFHDKCTGDCYAVGSCFSNTGMLKYQVLKMKKPTSEGDPPKFETVCSISSRWYSTVSIARIFGVTKNYIVFVEQPEVMCIMKMAATHLKGYAVKDWMEWKGDHEPNKFFVIEKSTGKIIMGQKVEIHSEDPFHGTSTINVYEEGESIVLDVFAGLDDEILHQDLDSFRKLEVDSCPIQIRRFRIPVVKSFSERGERGVPLHLRRKSQADIQSFAYRQGHNVILRHQLPVKDACGFAVAKINTYFTGRKYTYFYSTPVLNAMNSSKYFGKLCKVNMDLGEVTTWEPENARDPDTGKLKYLPSLPVFVPRPGNGNSNSISEMVEDDGVVISAVVTTSKLDTNFMVFLDAKTFKEIARVYFNEKMPMDIGGTYL